MDPTLNRRISTFLVLVTILAACCDTAVMATDRDGVHTFGKRVDGDRLLYRVKSEKGKAGFLSLMYQSPSTAEGPEITYAEVSVSRIYNETHAYVSSGGIGDKSIVIVLAMLYKNSDFSWEGGVYGI